MCSFFFPFSSLGSWRGGWWDGRGVLVVTRCIVFTTFLTYLSALYLCILVTYLEFKGTYMYQCVSIRVGCFTLSHDSGT